MARALIGALLGAVAMFVIGFIFFATPLAGLAIGSLDDNQAAAVQQALAANLPETGTYYVPEPSSRAQAEMFARGPVVVIGYNMRGFSPMDSGVMVTGFIHMLVVALLLALFLHSLSRHVENCAERAKITALAIVGVAIFARLGAPIWDHQGWGYAIYLLVSDLAMLGAAAAVILKLLPKPAAAPAAGEP
jgi:hypothetical protein